MEQCKKCGQKDISISFKHEGEKIYWSQHKEIENLDKFTRNDRYYTADSIKTECLIFSCKTCGYKKAEQTKDKSN